MNHSAQHPSKLREEIASTRGRRLSRSVSASSTQTAPYDAIQHNKSVSVSPHKGPKDTPEWKRRLLQGDVAYGEERDLFAPVGLESIFAPPPSHTPSPTKLPGHNFQDGSIYMPSSPPVYNLQNDPQEQTEGENTQDLVSQEGRSQQQPRTMRYKLVDVGESEFSANDLSRSSSFRPGMARNENQEQDVFSDPASNFESSAQSANEGLLKGAVRMVSGQSDMRNEELSPIYVSRHNTADGRIDYAALDLLPEELQERLEELRIASDAQNANVSKDGSQNPSGGDITAETEDLAHLDTFVNVRRGGLSHEGSFQRRLLSPSSLPAIDESALLPEESMHASTPKQLPNIRKTRPSREHIITGESQTSHPVPRTPHPSPTKSDGNGQKISTGSPLKLFGTYDTFTNQKLLRRLSQFEEHFDDESQQTIPSSFGEDSTHPEPNEAFVAASSPAKLSQRSRNPKNTTRKFSSFGEGELDGFQFSEDISYDPHGSSLQDEDKENISLPNLDPNAQANFRFQLEPSSSLDQGIFLEQKTRYVHTTSTTEQTISLGAKTRPGTGNSEDLPHLPVSQRRENLETPRKRDGDSGGKRLPRSPLKDPTPKRRRTLQKADFNEDIVLNDDDVQTDSLKETHQQMQSVIGRKRKDARHGDDQEAANPKVLAMLQILRPRTPSQSQRSSQKHGRATLNQVDPIPEQERLQREKIAKIQAELDSTDPLKLSTALGMSQQMLNDSRKGSVTTQDFLDEAKKIMAGIRGKARPRSGLTSVEESESENDRNKSAETITEEGELEDSCQDSTKEPFSRPPSREGGAPLRRLPQKQEDPELLNHLRQYQERSDIDDIIGSSVKSLAAAKEAAELAKQVERMTEETISRASGRLISPANIIESEPPNIRISENPEMQRKRKHSGSSGHTNGEARLEEDFPSHGSNGSSSQSTTHSIPTGSSRESDSRRIIAPHTVSHLIPEQLAGMVFDRERNIWVKRKTVGGSRGSHNSFPSDETEDDPFGDIPDLSVDETQELQRIKAVAAKRKEEERVAQSNVGEKYHKDSEGEQRLAQEPSKSLNGGRPQEHEPSSEPSKLTVFTLSGTVAETSTRVTSWGDDLAPITKPRVVTQNVHQSQKSKMREIREEAVEEVEKEISINEGRIHHSIPRSRRNVTISFSSPIASVIEPPPYEDGNSSDQEVDEASQSDDTAEEAFGDDSVIIHKRRSSQKTNSVKQRAAFRNTSNRISLGGHKFSARPVSRIDERDEEPSVDNNGQDRGSISVVLATPVPSTRLSNVVLATPLPTHEIGTLSLTPLSEFTVHHADESFGLEVSYIARSQRYALGSNTKRALSLSIKDLVQKITEVEPYEPFWEHIKRMDLKDKRLTSLHKLDEFCEHLEELDVSQNQISQLNGAPTSIRHLRITHNYLSDLTAWGHLKNLQYIDVSNNELETLSAFKCLIHLRELRADHNNIRTLDGIDNLDGLLTLRLRGNLVESLDFSSTKLQRLADLDLRDNRVREVKNIHELRALSALDLENNDLSSFGIEGSEEPCVLKYLKLGGNSIESIDVSQSPDLRLLYLDRNRVGRVNGLLKTKHLDSLSLREQQDGTTLNLEFLNEAFEVRKLFISGNMLHNFEPTVDFLNLQYLELANCGLESLPIDFGQIFPNTRVLNLNFNALRDIKPLLGIVRLKKLHLAGNRLSRLRKTTNVLAQFPTLTLVDLRSNPLTQGFYSPMLENRLVQHNAVGEDETRRPEPFTLGKTDRENDVKYAARLDMGTKMLRRMYEILTLSRCLRLRTLDGLPVDWSILSANDKVWEALLNAGVVEGVPTAAEKQEGQVVNPGEKEKEEPRPEAAPEPEKTSIWRGEDSFA